MKLATKLFSYHELNALPLNCRFISAHYQSTYLWVQGQEFIDEFPGDLQRVNSAGKVQQWGVEHECEHITLMPLPPSCLP